MWAKSGLSMQSPEIPCEWVSEIMIENKDKYLKSTHDYTNIWSIHIFLLKPFQNWHRSLFLHCHGSNLVKFQLRDCPSALSDNSVKISHSWERWIIYIFYNTLLCGLRKFNTSSSNGKHWWELLLFFLVALYLACIYLQNSLFTVEDNTKLWPSVLFFLTRQETLWLDFFFFFEK